MSDNKVAKLNQVIALASGEKNRAEQALTKAYHAIQKPGLLVGISRQYTPLNEDGDSLPAEYQKVQATAGEMLDATRTILADLFDIVLTQDTANTLAKADVVIDGVVIAQAVPVTHLLYMEKQAEKLVAFTKTLPVLDPSETWHFDDAIGCYVSAPTVTRRTQKVLKNHVKAPATDKFPAQVDTYTEDIPVGTWSTVKFSGALPQVRVNELHDRAVKLFNAVKVAREEANMQPAPRQQIGQAIFDYLLK